ncbi:hypothetical protein PR003_g6408 [Phytophthora rubi]|uniref:Integrase catalytic domain-containing protein n=1 Tax=Phytophthora rubi TaxID=129364 RepID=A0A6A4FGU9_9STRA|nr:hypothetical protein PR003_g6408 [Phytophthora rubi]
MRSTTLRAMITCGQILSSWGSSFTTIAAIHLVSLPVSPQLDDSFVWPTLEQVKVTQATAQPPVSSTTGPDQIVRDADGRIWLPAEATDLQLRICIVGHFGVAGHRSAAVTLRAIAAKFIWPGLAADVKQFVARCLHCASASGGAPVPRPLGALHSDTPNELLHWDFLHMGPAATGELYVLVLKDDASNYVWLLATVAATTDITYEGLLDWFAAFGVCRNGVSDQGTHFKNAVIQDLKRALGAHHHFTTPRCPWANGTVEVVVREVLRCAGIALGVATARRYLAARNQAGADGVEPFAIAFAGRRGANHGHDGRSVGAAPECIEC